MTERSPHPPPLVVGVAGGSGSGKTTVARKIVAGLPSALVATIQHDAYYRDRPDLSDEERAAVNYDHPESLETSLLVEHLRQLVSGQAAEVPRYDFKRHRRSEETQRVVPAPVVIVEGILVLADSRLRALFDITLFVDTADDIRAFRRIKRDMEERGRTFASIRSQYYETVRPMHLAFVEPSKRHADLIIPEGGDNRVALDVILARLRASLTA